MKGYITRKGDNWYVVIYQGLDPTTGKTVAGGMPPAPTGPRAVH